MTDPFNENSFCGQHSFIIVFYSAFNGRTLFRGNLENGEFQVKLKNRKILYLTIMTRYDTYENIVRKVMSFNGASNNKTPKDSILWIITFYVQYLFHKRYSLINNTLDKCKNFSNSSIIICMRK